MQRSRYNVQVDGKKMELVQIPVPGAGDCGFIAMQLTREDVYGALSSFTQTYEIRKYLWPEIFEAMLDPEYQNIFPENVRRPIIKKLNILNDTEETTAGILNCLREHYPALPAEYTYKQAIAWLFNHVSTLSEEDAGLFIDMKLSLKELKKALKKKGTKKPVFEAYTQGLRGRVMLGHRSAVLVARALNIRLLIWTRKFPGREIELSSYRWEPPNGEPRYTRHILHDGHNHYDVLLDQGDSNFSKEEAQLIRQIKELRRHSGTFDRMPSRSSFGSRAQRSLLDPSAASTRSKFATFSGLPTSSSSSRESDEEAAVTSEISPEGLPAPFSASRGDSFREDGSTSDSEPADGGTVTPPASSLRRRRSTGARSAFTVAAPVEREMPITAGPIFRSDACQQLGEKPNRKLRYSAGEQFKRSSNRVFYRLASELLAFMFLWAVIGYMDDDSSSAPGTIIANRSTRFLLIPFLSLLVLGFAHSHMQAAYEPEPDRELDRHIFNANAKHLVALRIDHFDNPIDMAILEQWKNELQQHLKEVFNRRGVTALARQFYAALEHFKYKPDVVREVMHESGEGDSLSLMADVVADSPTSSTHAITRVPTPPPMPPTPSVPGRRRAVLGEYSRPDVKQEPQEMARTDAFRQHVFADTAGMRELSELAQGGRLKPSEVLRRRRKRTERALQEPQAVPELQFPDPGFVSSGTVVPLEPLLPLQRRESNTFTLRYRVRNEFLAFYWLHSSLSLLPQGKHGAGMTAEFIHEIMADKFSVLDKVDKSIRKAVLLMCLAKPGIDGVSWDCNELRPGAFAAFRKACDMCYTYLPYWPNLHKTSKQRALFLHLLMDANEPVSYQKDPVDPASPRFLMGCFSLVKLFLDEVRKLDKKGHQLAALLQAYKNEYKEDLLALLGAHPPDQWQYGTVYYPDIQPRLRQQAFREAPVVRYHANGPSIFDGGSIQDQGGPVYESFALGDSERRPTDRTRLLRGGNL